MIDKSSGIPAYKQIEMSIKTDIERGVFPVHTKLPSEEDFSVTLGVSRGTVRQALAELASQGVVKRVHGNGTFVCERGNEYKIEDAHFISFLDSMESAGVQIETSVLGKTTIAARNAPVDLFSGDLQLFEVVRLRKINSRAVMLSYDFIPTDIVPNIQECYQDEKSIYDLLETRFSIRISKVKRVLHAVTASGEISRHLNVRVGEPLLFVVQQAFDEFGRCVDCANLYLVSDGLQLSMISRR